jgi:sec-independent protein translocase protein TatB
MFGLGFSEIVVILVVALLVLGPKKLPDIARQLGKVVRDLRHAAADFQTTLEQETRPLSEEEQPYAVSDPLARPRTAPGEPKESQEGPPRPKDPAG